MGVIAPRQRGRWYHAAGAWALFLGLWAVSLIPLMLLILAAFVALH